MNINSLGERGWEDFVDDVDEELVNIVGVPSHARSGENKVKTREELSESWSVRYIPYIYGARRLVTK